MGIQFCFKNKKGASTNKYVIRNKVINLVIFVKSLLGKSYEAASETENLKIILLE